MELIAYNQLLKVNPEQEACIYGTEGYIRLPFFWKAQSYEIVKNEEAVSFEKPYTATGYAHEIIEVAECIKQGKTESELFTINDSLMSARLVESILTTIFK